MAGEAAQHPHEGRKFLHTPGCEHKLAASAHKHLASAPDCSVWVALLAGADAVAQAELEGCQPGQCEVHSQVTAHLQMAQGVLGALLSQVDEHVHIEQVPAAGAGCLRLDELLSDVLKQLLDPSDHHKAVHSMLKGFMSQDGLGPASLLAPGALQ